MTTAIPENFPLSKLDRLNRIKITTFARRFVEEYYSEYQFGHFLMAAYAAVPALLTTDLLYKIWQNFYAYTWNGKQVSIHRIAVSDLLLSPLCTERGHDLYEMSEPVRLAFIEWLHTVAGGPTGAGWKQAGIHLPDDIARFVFEYEQSVNPGSWRWGVAYDIPQQINNLVYTAPAEAQQVLLSDLRNAKTETETLKVLNRIAAMDRQLNAMYRETNQQHLQQFRTLAQFADAWKSLIQQYDAGFLKRLHEMPELKALLDDDDSGIPVRIHKKTLKGVKSIAEPAFRALLIGIDKFSDPSMTSLNGCLNDVKNMAEIIRKYKRESDGLQFKTPMVLTNEQATIEAITAQIENFKQLNDGDVLLIHFSGHSFTGKKDLLFLGYDSVRQEDGFTGIAQTFIEDKLLDLILEKRVHVVWVSDTDYKITPEQYEIQKKNRLRSNKDPLKGSFVILHGAEVGKYTQEKVVAGKSYGLFSYSLHEVVMQHEPLDYQTLINKIREKTGYSQRPFLEAFPATAALSMFLTGNSGGKVYQVHFNPDRNLWLVNAGFVKGISPSAGFVPTILRTNDQLEWKVLTVTGDNSIVEPIAPSSAPVDQEATYDAIVSQMAPFKTRVALAEGSRKHLREPIASAGWLKDTDFYYPIANPGDAELKIAFTPSPLQYYITKNNPQQVDNPDAPIFLAGDNLREIERQLYWISRFYFVQRIEGQSAGILPFVKISLEKIEGQAWTPSTIDTAKSQSVEGSELTLRYIDGQQPAFRCKVSIDTHLQFAKMYFYAFYFGSGEFSIKQIDEHIIQHNSRLRDAGFDDDTTGNEFYLKNSSVSGNPISIPRYISEEVIKSGITTTDDTIFLVFSYEMLDLSVFEQQDIYQRSHTRKEIPDSFPEMRLSTWDVLRIPIKVIGPEFIQLRNKVRDLVGKAKIIEALDEIATWAHQNNHVQLKSDVTLLKRDFSSLRREKTLGLISSGESGMRQNKLTYQILNLMDSLEGSEKQPVEPAKKEIKPDLANPRIYFSYAQDNDKKTGNNTEKIFSELLNSLQKDGFDVVRDKEYLNYPNLISDFIREIGKHDLILVAISDKYLKSENSMLEIYEIFRITREDKDILLRKIFPIRVGNLNLSDPIELAEYFEFWENREIEWLNLIKRYNTHITIAQQNRFQRIQSIVKDLGSLLDFINEINSKSGMELSEGNFENIKKALLNNLYQTDK